MPYCAFNTCMKQGIYFPTLKKHIALVYSILKIYTLFYVKRFGLVMNIESEMTSQYYNLIYKVIPYCNFKLH